MTTGCATFSYTLGHFICIVVMKLITKLSKDLISLYSLCKTNIYFFIFSFYKCSFNFVSTLHHWSCVKSFYGMKNIIPEIVTVNLGTALKNIVIEGCKNYKWFDYSSKCTKRQRNKNFQNYDIQKQYEL